MHFCDLSAEHQQVLVHETLMALLGDHATARDQLELCRAVTAVLDALEEDLVAHTLRGLAQTKPPMAKTA